MNGIFRGMLSFIFVACMVVIVPMPENVQANA